MNITIEAQEVIEGAIEYAREKQCEYITPEMMLLVMCEQPVFREVFEEYDGDINELSDNLKGYIKEYVESENCNFPEFSRGALEVFAYAGASAANSSSPEIKMSHILHGIWKLKDSYAVYYMMLQDINEADLLREIAVIEDDTIENDPDSVIRFFEWDMDDMDISDEEMQGLEEMYDEMFGDEDYDEEDNDYADFSKEKSSSAKWKQYAPCLNETLHDVNPLIGREEELERTIQILCRKDKNNPLHIGEPGVGKTAITYGLVQLINEKKVPKPLIGSKIFALDLGGMLAGTQYRGDFEKRFKKVLAKIEKEEKPIIYIDEIHNLAGAGAVGESSFDASNMLKPYLAANHIRFIGATTFEEYKKYFEKNKSLVRRFQNVEITEPGEDETLKILEGLKEKYEDYHGVKYADDVLKYAVAMSAKHINERYLPDKAIDLIDEAGSYRKLHMIPGDIQTVDKEVINKVLTSICRVPLESVRAEESEELAGLEERLKNKIFGQDEAISQVVNAIKFSKAGLLEEGKPIASLLFVGPTGVGKTEVARSLAEELGVKLVRFDMSEYGEKHTIAKLIGSPAGYVGYEEGGLLTEMIRKNPHSVLLLDEIEKAHQDIFNVLLQVMDYATLTDNQGRKADFRNVVVIMTSNAGASRIGKLGIGFQSTDKDSSVVMEEVKRTFQPEFRNRLNRIVVFNGMDDNMASLITGKKIGELKTMLAKKNVKLNVTEEALDLIKKKGITVEFGAREVDRVIRNDIKPLFVDELLFGRLKNGGTLTMSVKDGSFVISVRKKRNNNKKL